MSKIYYSPFVKFTFGFFIIISFWSCTSDGDENPTGELAALDLFDQSYGSEPSQILDLYLPAGRSIEDTPVLIYIHGGAWIEGSKEEFIQFRTALSSSLPGYAFVAINYSLYNLSTGNNKFPTQENDVIEAVNYIESKTAEWNISDNIILSGASAGGHLALLHAYKHQSIGDIKAVIAFFPPTDLAELYDFSFITMTGLGGMLGGSPSDQPEAYVASSPITFVTSQSVPTVFFHGTSDPVVPISQSEILSEALESAGVHYKFTRVEDEGHGFQDTSYPPLFEEAADFVNNVLK
ncbi:alpha/beta hydrolase [Algoriphagus sp. D3-2-R+10]|uniref:alpha/beta hydrolase n=1 Tax=Algoriphagus aurantiacus TaxID=3103948 RepID=UPI002B3B7DB8|nr:alpha/beta hydrolase [Algoriphagus sp. D3-2-R+10]MEB2773689.1 alpha/beta hydrolase [Algoriphagus sp. D3-2-R+10]